MRLPATLYAERIEGYIRYRLEVPEHDVGLPLQQEFSHVLDEATVLALRQSADALLRCEETAVFPDEARRRGSVLYRTLVPPGLRDQLKALTGPLFICTSLYGVPWELLYDDEEFWGLRYAIGKRIMMSRPLTMAGGAALRSRPRALVVGSDPRGDLPIVHSEVERICETLERFADIRCVSGKLASFNEVTAYLREGFDLIHYCGHVMADRRGGPALLLADETPLAAEVIERNLSGRPLVFLNGCASARGTEHEATAAWEERLANVAYGFLFGGALAVVGTLCDVSDRHAASLAETFYEQVLRPLPVGEALRRARERCRADAVSRCSATWLSFVLYGNPAQMMLKPAAAPATAGPKETAVAPGPLDRSPPDAVLRGRWPARRASLWAAIVALVIGLAAGVGYNLWPRAPLVVGVMDVTVRGNAVDRWMPNTTRDCLRTVLTKEKPHIRPYSQQEIDFMRDQMGIKNIELAKRNIELAKRLGVSKMIDPKLSVAESNATLQVDIVEIPSGILDATESVRGRVDKFIELQNQISMKVLQALGVKPTDEVLKFIGERTNDLLEYYKLYNETLPGGESEESKASTRDGQAPETSSWLAVAFAQTPSAEEKAIHALLEQYRAALQSKDLEELARLQAEMTEAQRSALVRYFENAKDLAIRISDVEILVAGDEALATFTREDVFTDARSGRQLHFEVRISSVLGRQEGAWKIRSLKKPS